MPKSLPHQFDPRLDLVLERIVDVPRELVWRAWTSPEHLKPWFTPAPWKTVDCEIDLRPGGIFRTDMRGPNGEQFDNSGCVLEVIDREKLVWTGALGPGYRPQSSAVMTSAGFMMSAIIALETVPGGTKYTATAIHGDEESRIRHEQMGFHTGWGIALDQMVAMIKAG